MSSKIVGVITTQNLVPAGAATAGSAVSISTKGMGALGIQTKGTYTGALSAQVTVDGTNWVTLAASTTFTRGTTGATSATIASGVEDTYTISVAGADAVRVTGLAAMTGSVTVTLYAVQGGSAGAAAAGGGGAVTIASGADVDQAALLDTITAPSTGTQSIVASSATDVTILAANASRKGAYVYNDSTQVLYLLLSNATSSATVFTQKMAAGDAFSLAPGSYTGVIKGIWASANGNARVTEWS
jgi:hypothetical protein